MDFGAWYLELRTWLIAHPDAILIAVFLTALIEAVAVIGTVVPAVPLLFVLSVLAAHADIGLLPLFAVGMAGAMAGDSISYALGQNFQHRIHNVWPFSRYPQWLQHSEDFVRQHGGKSIIFGRFIGPLRAFVPMAAGIFRMKPVYFLWMNFLSALAWAPTHLLPGYSLGAATAHDWMPGRPQLLLIGAVLILVAVLTWLLPALDGWRRRRAERQPLANNGRAFCHDGRPEAQRAALRLALFSVAGFMLVAGLLPWLKPLDVHASGLLFSLRQSALDPLFVGLSLFGDTRGLLAFGTVLIGWLALRREWTLAAHALVLAVLALSVPALLKAAIDISRPALVMSPPDSAAFPSGHAFSSVLVWGFVLVCAERYRQDRITGLLRPLLLALPLLTMTARPYLGVHWLSDVLAGALLGLGCLALLRWSLYRRPAPTMALGELLFILVLAISADLMLEVLPRFGTAMAAYQPLPGLLPNYLLLP